MAGPLYEGGEACSARAFMFMAGQVAGHAVGLLRAVQRVSTTRVAYRSPRGGLSRGLVVGMYRSRGGAS